MNIAFELNGEPTTVNVRPDRTVRSVLREECGEKSVKSGCDSGRCGSCTVLVDGDAVKSCLVLAGKIDGRSVVTAAGIGETDLGNDVRAAFEDHAALQCGYCTPGFVVTVQDFLEGADSPNRAEIKSAIEGNVCRCTGYERILDAVEDLSNRDASGGQ
ncbi:MAG: (2Fe-2S)-binding protein [Halodesulfurarchaeum sp.]